MAASREMLAAILAAQEPEMSFDILLDLRRAQWQLSTAEIYGFAARLAELSTLRSAKIAILILPGTRVREARFLETCSVNRGLMVDTFSNYEDAIHWFFTTEGPVLPEINLPGD